MPSLSLHMPNQLEYMQSPKNNSAAKKGTGAYTPVPSFF